MKPRDAELILRAARLYYEKGKSQDEIALAISTSRSNVSRMLSDAKRLGFVQIRIVAPIVRHDSLSAQMKKLLGVHEVQVIGTDRTETTLTTVGRAAAAVLSRALKPNNTVAISWGRGVEATVVEMQSDALPGLKVTQLMGGLSAIATSLSAEELGRTLAQNLRAQFIPLLSPAVVSSAKTRDILIKESSIATGLELSRNANVALVGIGSNGSASSKEVLRHFHLGSARHKEIEKIYAGDISARFFDERGDSLSAQMDERVVGLTLEEISKIPHVIGVAAGTEKASGVLGAGRAGIIRTLVTDVACANEVLRLTADAKMISRR